MAKSKTSRASRKKNKKGAAGKQASSDSTSRERANADFRQFQMDEGLPPLSQKVLQNANHQIQNQSLGTKEQETLLKKTNALFDKDIQKWVGTVLMSTAELYSSGSSMSVIFHKLIFPNFYFKNYDLIDEKVKAASVKTGLDSSDLVIDLDFTRRPPAFEVLPVSIFWNREKDKAPANHWFFKDLGRGQTYYSDDHIKEIRKSFSSKQEMLGLKTLGLDLVFVFLNFGDLPAICAIPSSMESMARFLESVRNGLEDASSTKDDTPTWKRAEYEKN